MKHIADRKYTTDSDLERANLTGGTIEQAKPIYIEDKWSLSGLWNDRVARKRAVLLVTGLALLFVGMALGYRAASVPGTLRTQQLPNSLSFGTFDTDNSHHP